MLYSGGQTTASGAGVSNIAHLGGAFIGFAYASWIKMNRGSGKGGGTKGGIGEWFTEIQHKWHQRRMRKKLRVIRTDEKKQTYH